MSEHTPTTDEIREQYATAWWDDFSTLELDAPGGKSLTSEEEARFDRWHVAEISAAKAEAWDEGYMARGNHDHHTNMSLEKRDQMWSNPYRAEEVAES